MLTKNNCCDNKKQLKRLHRNLIGDIFFMAATIGLSAAFAAQGKWWLVIGWSILLALDAMIFMKNLLEYRELAEEDACDDLTDTEEV